MKCDTDLWCMVIRLAIVVQNRSKILQVTVRMEIFDCVMVRRSMKDGWKCALMEYGGLYIMLDGQERILQLLVGNLVTNLKVYDH